MEKEELIYQINDFVWRSNLILNEISNSKFESDSKNIIVGDPFRKILYMTFLDSLAKIRYPECRKNNERFIEFVKKYTGYEHWNRVSIPQTKYALEYIYQCISNKDIDLKKGFNDLFFKLNNYLEEKILKLSNEACFEIDPELDEINNLDLWPNKFLDLWKELNKDNKKFAKLRKPELKNFTHIELFYKNRCFLVHEMNDHSTCEGPRPGRIFNQPYYSRIGMTRKEKELYSFEDIWRIIYPKMFLINICEKAIENIKTYLEKENNIDLLEIFSSRNDWMD